MEHTIFIAGGDQRQMAMIRQLEERGVRVFSFGFRAEDRLTPETAAQLCAADTLLLPVPSVDESLCLNAPFMEKKLPIEMLWSLLRPEQRIFGAMLSKAVLQSAAEYRLKIVDYYLREEFVLRNAYITAECALRLSMEVLQKTLRAKRCLVLGYGRIGTYLAHLLRALGAEVTVAARSAKDRLRAELDGCSSCTFDLLCKKERYDVIYNTVPHLVMDREVLERAGDACLCIDLASKPGGIDFAAAEKLGVRAVWALGLPGKMAPCSAGEAILDTVFQILEEEVPA